MLTQLETWAEGVAQMQNARNKATLQAQPKLPSDRVQHLQTPYTAQDVLHILDNKMKNERRGGLSVVGGAQVVHTVCRP